MACPCGGPDKVGLVREGAALVCPCCLERYEIRTNEGYVDLNPRTRVGEITQYADAEFHERLHVTDAPPLLSARVKMDVMRRALDPRTGESVLDLGCGPGKFALFAASGGALATGVDVAPFFLPKAARSVDLVHGDLRRLPFHKGTFPSAYSLDVLEHFEEKDLLEVLTEARRVIGLEGRLFVYTHAMESSKLASFQRATNRLAKRLGRAGLLDSEREALRKSDHKNPIKSHEHFARLCTGAGLEVVSRRYYNVVFKAVVEDLVLRLYEHARRRGEAPAPPGEGSLAPGALPGSKPPGRLVVAVGLALTWLLKLDVVLFGAIRTGPFFGMLRPRRP